MDYLVSHRENLLPELTEVWSSAGKICDLYTGNDNTLFIPESRAGEQGAVQMFHAIGKYRTGTGLKFAGGSESLQRLRLYRYE